MRFTLDWCVFAYPGANQSAAYIQCSDTCSGSNDAVQLAMIDRLLQINSTLQYQYCEDGNGAFSQNVESCTACLAGVPSSQTLISCTEFTSTHLHLAETDIMGS